MKSGGNSFQVVFIITWNLILIQMYMIMPNEYQSNSYGKDTCIRLCKDKEEGTWKCRRAGGKNLHPIHSSLSNFPVCKKPLSCLNNRAENDLARHVEKILCKCVTHVIILKCFYVYFPLFQWGGQVAPFWLKSDFLCKTLLLQTVLYWETKL